MVANTMTYGSAAFRSKLAKRWTTEVRVSVDNQEALELLAEPISGRSGQAAAWRAK